jgi:hypothetical protein
MECKGAKGKAGKAGKGMGKKIAVVIAVAKPSKKSK